MKSHVVPFIRSPFNYDMESSSDESSLLCLDPSLAQQNFKDETDINTIVKRFNITGELPNNVAVPQYGDFLDVTDYHSALNLVIKAEDSFMAMPAEVRSRFNNDPGAFLDFVYDGKNRDEAARLGLLVEPVKVSDTSEPQPDKETL
nr:MAG: internal scaffolding protein [Microvirus sp.]